MDCSTRRRAAWFPPGSSRSATVMSVVWPSERRCRSREAWSGGVTRVTGRPAAAQTMPRARAMVPELVSMMPQPGAAASTSPNAGSNFINGNSRPVRLAPSRILCGMAGCRSERVRRRIVHGHGASPVQKVQRRAKPASARRLCACKTPWSFSLSRPSNRTPTAEPEWLTDRPAAPLRRTMSSSIGMDGFGRCDWLICALRVATAANPRTSRLAIASRSLAGLVVTSVPKVLI